MHDEKQTFPLQENLIGVMSASWTLWRKVLLAKREHKSRARNSFCVHNSVNFHGYFKSYIRNYHLPSPPLFALFAFAYEINFLCFGLGDTFFGKESLIWMLSDYWCMRKFCAFEWRLLEFQHPFLLSCAAQQLIIFEFLTVIIYFVTLKKYGFTKSLMQFLTDTSKSFVKTLMVKLRLTDPTSEPYFTKISQSSLVGIVYYKFVRQEEKDSGLQQFSKIHRPSAGW